MTRRLIMLCLATMFLIGNLLLTVQAKDDEDTRKSLRNIRALGVLTENLSDGAKVLGLTVDNIQTDVELKLRLAGMHVVTDDETYKLPGMPHLYVRVSVADGGNAAYIEVELEQNARLERDGQPADAVATWSTSALMVNPTGQGIRNATKDRIDMFVNAWLSVNPKK